MNRPKEERLVEQMVKAFGPVVAGALADDAVTDIMCNENGTVWIERLGEPMRQEGTMDSGSCLRAIQSVAAMHDEVVTRDRPVLSCELPEACGRARFEGTVEPASVGGPCFAIRKLVSRFILLDEYEREGAMTAEERQCIETAIRDHRNIVVAGGTGSGKTTLVNAILAEIARQDEGERIFVLEDLSELHCPSPNQTRRRTYDAAPMVELIRSALRNRPDRIVIGEVRGGEAWELLNAWNTGHPGGCCTIHAGAKHTPAENIRSATKRLEQLCARHPDSPRNLDVLREVVRETVDLIVYVARGRDGKRRVEAIGEPD